MLIDGTLPAIGDIVAVARGRERVTVADDVLARLADGVRFAERTAAERPVYGRTTGVGANRGVAADDDTTAHALRLLRSHATSAGSPRSTERVRALLTVRAVQLATDGNGVQPEALSGLVSLLDEPPVVREYAGLGTGDLSALGTVGLSLVEHGWWRPDGDALAFCSSNAATLADAVLALHDLDSLAHAALTTAALTMVAARGNPEAFAPGVERATPFPGAATVCRTLRALLAGIGEPARIQDSYGLRTLPQVHGPLLDALAHATSVARALVGAPSENPLVSATLGVAHHAGFHVAYLGQALDGVRSALAQALQASLARITLLSDPVVTGLRPFLADDAPAASGTMVVEYAAAAALADVRALAQPAGLQTVTISRGMEDDASFASLAARQALASLAPARTVVAAELLCAVRAITASGAVVPAPLAPTLSQLAPLANPDLADRDLTGDLETAAGLLAELRVVAPRVAG